MKDLMRDFLEGRLAVLVDKELPEEIETFYSMFAEHDFDYPKAYGNSMLEYLHDRISGPYHFVRPKENLLTGAGYGYIKDNEDMYCCSVKEFIDSEKRESLEENDYLNILFEGDVNERLVAV